MKQIATAVGFGLFAAAVFDLFWFPDVLHGDLFVRWFYPTAMVAAFAGLWAWEKFK